MTTETMTTAPGFASIPACQPGAWISLDYNGAKREFYVREVSATGATVCSPDWLASSTMPISHAQLRAAEYIGQGKPRTWWQFAPMRDFFTPFTRPKSRDKGDDFQANQSLPTFER